ncbi:MAG TPA: sigma-70 family RNA polymerase sigma factor [Candidatus Limnocylindrales bacterium]|nr:sigma-70 family RNA polymerase sigma factor [Candidatus Limnocylindrales bacterium]
MNDRGLAIDEGETRRLIAAGDERADAFAGLADRHLAQAYRLASVILGDEVEGQDAVGDAAVAAWEGFGSLRDRERFDAWFDRILVNGCRDRLRRRGRVRLIDIDGGPEPSTADGSGSVAERDALRGALAGLSPEQRVTVVLRYYGDLSLEEIAERTGERLGTVKSRLHYGLGALRAAYDAASRLPGEASR